MSNAVADIESAIEELPTQELLQVAAWLDDYRLMIQASEDLFQSLDSQEGTTAGRQWLGDS
jgi:hypothetical protein